MSRIAQVLLSGDCASLRYFFATVHNRSMVSRKKIDLARVLSSLNVTCPHCGYSIPPHEQVRVSNEEMRCPNCEREFQR